MVFRHDHCVDNTTTTDYFVLNILQLVVYSKVKEGGMSPLKIEQTAVYDDNDLASILRMPGKNAVCDKRSRGGRLPKSFRVGKRRLTRGSAILEFLAEAEMVGRI